MAVPDVNGRSDQAAWGVAALSPLKIEGGLAGASPPNSSVPRIWASEMRAAASHSRTPTSTASMATRITRSTIRAACRITSISRADFVVDRIENHIERLGPSAKGEVVTVWARPELWIFAGLAVIALLAWLMAIVLTIWAGVGRLRSILVAGILLGIIEAVSAAWAGPRWRETAVALLLLGSLLARSGGLARGMSAAGHGR